jgi:NTE family protein
MRSPTGMILLSIPLSGLLMLTVSCAILHGNWHAYPNQPGSTPTRSNFIAEDVPPGDGMFIGVALSGGGSRAANFGAAALLELQEKLGGHPIDVVSSVAGGSLPAAYLALDKYSYRSWWFRHREIRFTKAYEDEIKDRLQRNYQVRFVARWLLPWNMFRFWLTDFNRTDIMVPVLDANLYHGAPFADLAGLTGPKLLINASEMGEPKPFPFVDETFAELHSDLSQERISVAVAASLAVPGFFHHVVLEDRTEPPSSAPYRHLSDAAVTDNLGLKSLFKMLESGEDGARDFPNGCVLIAIDASPAFLPWKRTRSQTREFPKDYLFDRNASDAIDYVLLDQRAKTLLTVGMMTPDTGPAFGLWLSPDKTFTCRFWHIALRRVPPGNELLGYRWDELSWQSQIRLIPTELNMWDWQQRALFEAAKYLVEQGWHDRAKTWFPPQLAGTASTPSP